MTNQNKGSSRLVIAIVVLSILGIICLIKDISPAFASKHRCAKAGCNQEAAEGSAYINEIRRMMTRAKKGEPYEMG